MRYNPPPNWPTPPAGWTPPQGWQPDASWPPPPPGWVLWIDDSQAKSWPARHKILTAVGTVFAVLVVIGASLSISGTFNQGSTAEVEPPTPAVFRKEVAGYCRLALEGAPATAGQGQAEKARSYLEVIETVRGRFESLVQPTLPDIALERFSTGLVNAANFTSDVAKSPAPAGSAAEAKDVAELTFAAGQVQAGAVGYELGHDCVAIGDLVARSAENAAAP